MAAVSFASKCQAFTSSRSAGITRQSRGRLAILAAVTAERSSIEISKCTPLNDRILVKPYVEGARSIGGILLPSAPSKQNSDAHFGTVVAVGPEVKLELKEGDAVVFQKYAMAEVEVPEGEILFVAEKSVLGLLSN